MSRNLKMSVVTPSYNQAEFLEQTIKSVLSQDYPNLEYIIIDGGSTDNSIEIIKKYQQKLAHWISEKDRGQSHAINKGFSRATGEILAWLNSDDYYEPGIISYIMNIFSNRPDILFITCPVNKVNVAGKYIETVFPPSTSFFDLFNWRQHMPQAGTFFRKKLLEDVGYLDESLSITFDYDLWFRCARRTEFYHANRVASSIRIHPEAKTSRQELRALGMAEAMLVQLRYCENDLMRIEILKKYTNQIVARNGNSNKIINRALKKIGIT